MSIQIAGQVIRELCERGNTSDINQVFAYLNEDIDIVTTKFIDFYLSTVTNPDGLKQIESMLFNGTQIQRNYSCLYYLREHDWEKIDKAFELGLVDKIQAYAR